MNHTHHSIALQAKNKKKETWNPMLARAYFRETTPVAQDQTRGFLKDMQPLKNSHPFCKISIKKLPPNALPSLLLLPTISHHHFLIQICWFSVKKTSAPARSDWRMSHVACRMLLESSPRSPATTLAFLLDSFDLHPSFSQ